MINKAQFEKSLKVLQRDLEQLTVHCNNELSKGLSKPFVLQYQFIINESDRLHKMAAVSLKESSMLTRSPQNFLKFYGEIAVLDAGYNKSVEDQVRGRGSYDLSIRTSILMNNLATCVS